MAHISTFNLQHRSIRKECRGYYFHLIGRRKYTVDMDWLFDWLVDWCCGGLNEMFPIGSWVWILALQLVTLWRIRRYMSLVNALRFQKTHAISSHLSILPFCAPGSELLAAASVPACLPVIWSFLTWWWGSFIRLYENSHYKRTPPPKKKPFPCISFLGCGVLPQQ